MKSVLSSFKVMMSNKFTINHKQTATVQKKDDARDDIAKHIKAFKKAGGKIQKIKTGAAAYVEKSVVDVNKATGEQWRLSQGKTKTCKKCGVNRDINQYNVRMSICKLCKTKNRSKSNY